MFRRHTFTLAAATVDVGVTSGVITGIGFLGAAMVFKSENKVFGLTTAALIWATAAIGFAIGIGVFLGAIVATGLILVLLVPVEKLERKILKTHTNNCSKNETETQKPEPKKN
jgi:putative Mg2+ transporter-C (MgtC) family protein